jgi:hypothetical protein
MSSTLGEIVEALAAALEPIRATIDDVQIYPYYLIAPTPPAIDIYPGDPFQNGTGFGGLDPETFFTVRARASTADSDAGQQLLLQLLDTHGPASVEAALTADQTLGGAVDSLAIGEQGTPGVTGYREYMEDAAVNGRLLGCEWRVRVLT